MKRLPLAALLAAGCSFASPKPAGPTPLNHDELAAMVKSGQKPDAILATARERGVDPLSAECIVDLKKAGASDELVTQLLSCQRRRESPEEQHARFHDASQEMFGPIEWRICGWCGEWVRVRAR